MVDKEFFVGESGKRWIVTSPGAGVEEGQKFELQHDLDPSHPSGPHAVLFRPAGDFGDGYWSKMKSVHYDPTTGSVKGWFSRLQNPQQTNYTVEFTQAHPGAGCAMICRVKNANAGSGVVDYQVPGEFGADEDG